MNYNKQDFLLCLHYLNSDNNDNLICCNCHISLNIDNILLNPKNCSPILYNGLYICKECSSKLKKCSICNCFDDNREHCLHLTEDTHEYICEKCIQMLHLHCCESCNKLFRFTEKVYHCGYLCLSCMTQKNVFKCDRCNGHFLQDRYGINHICITCANEQVANCLNYTCKPIPNFKCCKNEDSNSLYMGVELEAGHAPHYSDVMTFIDNNANSFFYMKRDASIPAYGCEIVTHPATLKYHMERAKWDKLLNDAIESGLQSDNDKCGIHIHMNRSFFDWSKHVKILDYIINNFNDFWKKFARRESRYSTYVHKRSIEWGIQTTDRHCALNLSNENTIEIRIFKGTLDYNILMAYIQGTYCLANFVKEIDNYIPNVKILTITNDEFEKIFIDYCISKNMKILNQYLEKLR